MEMDLLTRGLVLGFSIAAPVGPIGVLCIRRSLVDGFCTGLCTGLGAALADAVYGLLAAAGLAAVSALLVSARGPLHFLGGLFLIYLGLRTCCAKPDSKPAAVAGGLFRSFASTFFLTLTNPMTILSFAAIFAGLGVASGGRNPVAIAWLVSGVFFGSVVWWLLLSSAVSIFKDRIDQPSLVWVNRASGAIICGFGFWSLLS